MAVTYLVRMRALPGNAERVGELLMVNVDRILAGEPGNLAFAVHRSVDDPDEFWLYETWESAAAVEAHESGDAFKQYKDALRPLVDPESLVFGNCEPVAALGYRLPEGGRGYNCSCRRNDVRCQRPRRTQQRLNLAGRAIRQTTRASAGNSHPCRIPLPIS